jgi:hypothetical protein
MNHRVPMILIGSVLGALPEVRAIAADDPSPSLRALVLLSMAEFLARDHSNFDFICERAVRDLHSIPRAAALYGLGIFAAARFGTQVNQLLREQAENDPGSGPRAETLWALATSGLDDLGARRLLCYRARVDPDPYVRQRAIHLLSEFIPSAPEILELFCTIARGDQNSDVQGEALLAWATGSGEERIAQLVSRDFDGSKPGLSLSEPVDEERVQEGLLGWLSRLTRSEPTTRRSQRSSRCGLNGASPEPSRRSTRHDCLDPA